MDTKLLPCPFCGGNASTGYIRDGRIAGCCNCFAKGPAAFHGRADQPSAEERAISGWNTRIASPRNEVRADGGCLYCDADQGESHRPGCTLAQARSA